jgi:hypothetical protein
MEAAEPWEVDGRLEPDVVDSGRRLFDDARSLGAGDPWRDLDSSSFNRFVRSNCSNRNLKSCAHSSPNWLWPGGPFPSSLAMMSQLVA